MCPLDNHPCTGIALWETVVDGSSRYGAMQSNFHTFASAGNTYAIQFVRYMYTILAMPPATWLAGVCLSCSEVEAARMLESMQDLLAQHRQQVALTPMDPPTQPVVFKRPTKPPRRLNKKDISAPCNFKHVSGVESGVCYCLCTTHFSGAGITMKRTSSCEQELRGTIQRKMRSLSLSNLSHHKATAGSH